MLHTEFIGWGLQMTVLGMGLVFTLLALLWLLLTLVLKFDKEDAPAGEAAAEEAEAASPGETAEAAPGEAETPEAAPAFPLVNGMDAGLVAAILVAVDRHRQTLRRQAAPLVRAAAPGSRLYASRWLAAGRARQTHNWHPRGK